ncbi:MAG TPA: hypothetical protein PLL66_08205 [Bacteroidales bacterium]|nr:hypothetical protein [Bacteroidales bacterium]
MTTKEIINKFLKILYNPVLGWLRYDSDKISFKDIISPFLVMTLITLFISRFVGKTLAYLSVTDAKYIILYAVVNLVIDILYFFIIVFSVNGLLPYFNIKKSKSKVAALTFVSLIPFYLGIALISLFPGLFFLGIISLYTFFVLYWAVVNLLKPAKSDIIVIYSVISLLFIGVYLVLNFALVYPFFDFVF